MRHYEIVMLVHPDRAGRANAICDRIDEMVGEGKGRVHRREDIGRRTLAYPIAGLQKAHYFLMNVECVNDTYDRIEEYLKHNKDVLRRLTVRCDQAQTEPSALMLQTSKDRKRLTRDYVPSGEAGTAAKETTEVTGAAEAKKADAKPPAEAAAEKNEESNEKAVQ